MGPSGPTSASGTAEYLSFDRPESWALKYFSSVTTFTPLGPPRFRKPGEIELGLEAGWIPYLSESDRTVGFDGTKVEDLNKSPIYGRPRLLVGLPAGLSVEVGWVPPVKINGAEANLFDAALERPFFVKSGGSFGWRIYGQFGHAFGDYTCPSDVVGYPPGSSGNPYRCMAASTDAATLNNAGAALTGGVKVGHGVVLHFAGGATYHDLQFQVGAYWNGVADNTLLVTHGWTGWGSAGADFAVGKKTSIAVETFYSPLAVKRPPNQDTQNDGLFNIRGMFRYYFR